MFRPTRLLALGGIVLLGLLYWKPVHAYMHTKQVLQRRNAQVALLATQNRQLTQQIANIGQGDTLVREARQLDLVKPGEQLFIVRGITAWRHHR